MMDRYYKAVAASAATARQIHGELKLDNIFYDYDGFAPAVTLTRTYAVRSVGDVGKDLTSVLYRRSVEERKDFLDAYLAKRFERERVATPADQARVRKQVEESMEFWQFLKINRLDG